VRLAQPGGRGDYSDGKIRLGEKFSLRGFGVKLGVDDPEDAEGLFQERSRAHRFGDVADQFRAGSICPARCFRVAGKTSITLPFDSLQPRAAGSSEFSIPKDRKPRFRLC
jgi:hypothetical protein